MAEPDFTRTGSTDPANAPIVEISVRPDTYLVKVNDVYVKIVWTSRAGRVTLGYLRTGKHSIAREVRQQLETSPYLLNGRTSLDAFIQDLNEIIAERAGDPVEFKQNAIRRQQLALLAVAKQDALDTARAERVSRVNRNASMIFPLAALIVTLGASTYGYATNKAVEVQAEKDEQTKDVVTGELRPATPSEVLLVIPASDVRRSDIQAALGADCNLSGVPAILLDVASPPPGQPAEAVMRLVTERSDKCAVTEVWSDPDWLTPRPKTAPEAPASPNTTAVPAAPAAGG